jgi:hypothetical protein
MDFVNSLKIGLLLIGSFYALRVPYLLIFAQYVKGREMSSSGWMETMDVWRGTSTFWIHCVGHVMFAVLVTGMCYLVILTF